MLFRRWLFGIVSVALVGLVCAGCQDGAHSARKVGGQPERRPAHGTEALDRLVQGNKRFVSGRVEHPNSNVEWRSDLVQGQEPFVALLSCSDSRVPPELLFDQGFGDIFVVRVAGNVVDSAGIGSIEYAVYVLHAPLILVLGHEECGAVKTAMGTTEAISQLPVDIQTILKLIHPALPDAGGDAPSVDRLRAAVEANVRHGVEELSRVPGLQKMLADGSLKIAGGVYELDTGAVRLLP